ncbi:MAG: recombination protein O N-terminal domain-containing protein [Acetobacteraceae bacterium]|nr:recombination protein O N-terminal domain-containing protein [Acetobacteraceae bacterium]
MEAWEDEAVVLAARPHGEGHAIATVFTRTQGVRRGLVYGGAGRRGRATWQPGNVLAARWRARLSRPVGEAGRRDGVRCLGLGVGGSARPRGASPPPALWLRPRCRKPSLIRGLMRRWSALHGPSCRPAKGLDWRRTCAGRVVLLAELGLRARPLGLRGDQGRARALPSSRRAPGRAVSGGGSGALGASGFCRCPAFLIGEAPAAPEDFEEIAAGLRLTGHFLARDVFGSAHRSPPPARERLGAAVAALAAGSPRAEHA